MHLDLRPFLYLWVALAAILVVLFGWRQILARREDDSLHVLPQEGSTSSSVDLAPKIEQIDKWGKLGTIAVVVYGLIMGALYIYQGFNSPGLPGA